jgi:stage V sporulation protein AD
LAEYFDVLSDDALFGQDTWEAAESHMVRQAVTMAIDRAELKKEDIRYIFAGDLLGQLIATTFGIKEMNIPAFGLYGACSTCGESLSLAAMTVAAGFADYAVAATSSHYGSAEKQFRFPLEYGNQRPLSTTWTVTGGGAFVVGRRTDTITGIEKNGTNKTACNKIAGKEKANGTGHICITGITTGKIVDYGVKDSFNMGACMAPAAADLIYQNLQDFNVKPTYYDKIITGDLGRIGQHILLDLLDANHIDIHKQHMDCGIEIYNNDEQDTHSGGSGCGCSAITLAGYILRQMREGVWKRVLFVPTGALLSTVSYNEGQNIPGIAHGIILERKEEVK